MEVRDKKTRALVKDRDVILSLVATDESVFTKIEDRKQPPSLAAALYL